LWCRKFFFLLDNSGFLPYTKAVLDAKGKGFRFCLKVAANGSNRGQSATTGEILTSSLKVTAKYPVISR
jgi:hypothetical protein